jgi:hypothetical protein
MHARRLMRISVRINALVTIILSLADEDNQIKNFFMVAI